LPRSLQRRRRNIEAGEKGSVVVSNSSVVIALARICCLDFLEKLFGKIVVPEAVWQEITVGGKPGSEKVLKARFIHVEEMHRKRLALLFKEFVDDGEAEAITLALEINADILLADDREARSLAKKLGLQVMGTLAVIALAKYRGLISEAKPIVNKLIESGFWISEGILEEFLKKLGEH